MCRALKDKLVTNFHDLRFFKNKGEKRKKRKKMLLRSKINHVDVILTQKQILFLKLWVCSIKKNDTADSNAVVQNNKKQ